MMRGGPLHVERIGSGPPLVLLHGLGSSHVHWLGVGQALARARSVHIPDLPGFGLTPLAGRRTDVESNAAVLAGLLEGLDAPAVVVGNSMGALVALIAARDHPRLVAALVLVSPPAPGIINPVSEPRLAALFSAYAWPVAGELTRVLWVRLHGPEGMVRSVLAMTSSSPDRVSLEVVDAARRLALGRAHQDEVHTFLAAYRSTLRYVLNPWRFDALLRDITPPVLVIQGTADRLLPAAVARRVRRARPDWTFVSLPGAGHMPQLDDPAAFVERVSDWLAETGVERREAG